MEIRYNNVNPAAKQNKTLNTPYYSNNTTNATSNSNNYVNTVVKFNNGRQEHRTLHQSSTPYNIPECSIQQKVLTPGIRDSQSFGYKEYVDARPNVDYSNFFHQKQQQQQQQYNQQLPWTSINSNRSYPDNISSANCSNRTQSFQNSRSFYMQFNPYITQRALIASHNQQHSVEINDPQTTNVRFSDYDYTLR